MYQISFDVDHFLQNYWEQRPVVFSKGLDSFTDPISPEELAGLAMEEELHSRLVTIQDQTWQVTSGPFEDFSPLEKYPGSLLVQGVNHWHPDVAELARAFQFIANWQFDDVMISYSSEGGGVGPHIDQYGVFIIQGEGRRRWRVGEKQQLKQFSSAGALKHCEEFVAVIDEELEPGDVLYIPPGCPHEGYATEPCLNYSVGFRSPSAQELLSAFADHMLQQDDRSQRYSDPHRLTASQHGRIAEHELIKLHKLLADLLADPTASTQFLGEHLSESPHSYDLVSLSNTEDELDLGALLDCANEYTQLSRVEGLKALYLDTLPYTIFVDGLAVAVPKTAWALAQAICNEQSVAAHSLASFSKADDLQWLLDLVNTGYWYFE